MVGKTTSENLEKYRSKFHSIRPNYQITYVEVLFYYKTHIIWHTQTFFHISHFPLQIQMKHGYEGAAKTFLGGSSQFTNKKSIIFFQKELR